MKVGIVRSGFVGSGAANAIGLRGSAAVVGASEKPGSIGNALMTEKSTFQLTLNPEIQLFLQAK